MPSKRTTRPTPIPTNLDPLPSMDRASHVAAVDGLGDALTAATKHHKTLADGVRDLTARLEREREQHAQSIAQHAQEMADAQEAHEREYNSMLEEKTRKIEQLTTENNSLSRRVAAFAEKAARAVAQAQDALDYAHTSK